jgi:hypothetical protein
LAGGVPGRRTGRFRLAAAAWLAALAAGCGGAAPGAPSTLATAGVAGSEPGARILTVVSGATEQPVPGAEVVVGGRRLSTDGAGAVALPAGATGAVDVLAAGFLSRQTRLGPDRITLWPVGPGRGPDYVRAIIYQSSAAGGAAGHGPDQPLQRVAAARVVVSPSRELLRDAAAMAAHRAAIAQLNDVTEGGVSFSLGGSVAGAAVFETRVDAALPWLAAAYKQLSGSAIAGGRIAFCSLDTARQPRFVAHELGHALGLQHSASTGDLMYFEARSGGASAFSEAERLTVRLLLQRRPGNHFPDNDRDGSGAAQASVVAE